MEFDKFWNSNVLIPHNYKETSKSANISKLNFKSHSFYNFVALVKKNNQILQI